MLCDYCQGQGHTAICGDEDTICKFCDGSGEMKPLVVVDEFPFSASVIRKGSQFYLFCDFMGRDEDLKNAFCRREYIKAIVIGKALIAACAKDVTPPYMGYGYDIGLEVRCGWLTYQGAKINYVPSAFTAQSGYEVGVALFQLGLLMRQHDEFAAWLEMAFGPKKLAV